MWGRAPRKKRQQVVARVAETVDGGKYADDADGGDAENYRRTARQSMTLCEFVCGIGGGRSSGQVVVRERKSQTTVAEIAVRRGEGSPQRVCAPGPGTCDSPSVYYYSVASALWSPFFLFLYILSFLNESIRNMKEIFLTKNKAQNVGFVFD